MILAFDIGGSRIRAATWDGARLAALGELPTPVHDKQAFAAAVGSFAEGREALGIAIAIAGVVDPIAGLARSRIFRRLTGWHWVRWSRRRPGCRCWS